MQHPLLKPRYEVIADYPNSPHGVGDILEQYGDSLNSYRLGDMVYHNRQPEDYPSIFKKLQWWEHREGSEMPTHVKFLKDIQGIPAGTVRIVNRWVSTNRGWVADIFPVYLNEREVSECIEPSTAEEAYHQSKA